MADCFWKGTTSKGRVLLVGQNATAPTVAASEFPSCTSSGRTNRFGYPPPLRSSGGGYSAWCLDNDESIVSIESYDCEDVGFDCVNGGCVPKATYQTPGKYESLAVCEAGCAKDSTCTGECVSQQDLNALQQAAAKVRGKLCGGWV
jgi:hypothetical protein